MPGTSSHGTVAMAEVQMVAPRLEDLLRDQAQRRAEVEAAGAYFVGGIDDQSAEAFARSLLLMAVARVGRSDRPITVYVNSPGGSVGASFSMMEIKSHTIEVYHAPLAGNRN